MATYTASSGYYTTTLTITQGTQSTSNNTSVINWNLKLVSDGGVLYHWTASCPWYVKINTVTVDSGTFSYDLRSGGTQTILNKSGTTTVTHKADGTLSVEVVGYTDMDNTPYVYPMTASGTFDLTTIPRASDVSASNATISASSGNYSFTITSKADFYHKWRYAINGTTSDWSSALHINTTSNSPTIANTALLSAMSNTAKSTITIEVQTYSDSACTNLVGTKTTTATITVTLKPSAPTLTTIGFRSRSSGVDSSISTPTAGFTTVALTAWSNGTSQGASSYTTYFSVNQGATLKKTSATANNTVIETNTLPASAKQYTLTMTAYTVDSRGNQSANATKTIVVYGYSIPILNLTAYRTATDENTDTAEDGAGLFAYVAFSNTLKGLANTSGALISSNPNSVLSATCKYGSTAVSSGQHISLSADSTITFTYTVKDKFTTTSTTVTVAQAKYPLDLYDDGEGSVGVAFGAIAEANKVKSAMPMVVTSDLARTWYYQETHDGGFYVGWGGSRTRQGIYSSGYATDTNTFVTDGKWLLLRDSDGSVTLNGNATTASRANNATYADWTETNPTSTTPYWIPFGAGHSTNTTNRGLLTNDGLVYRTREGTATAVGYAILEVGNSINQGTAGNKYGSLRLRSATTDKYSDLACRSSEANNNTCWLPGAPQSVALEGTRQLWTGTKTSSASDSGTSIPKLALYKRARFYAIYKGNASMIWDADVTKIVALNKECEANHTELSYMSWSGGSGYYQTFFKVSLTPSGNNMTLKFTEVRNFSVPYTGSTGTAQTGSGDYYIYRVDGVAGY